MIIMKKVFEKLPICEKCRFSLDDEKFIIVF